MEEEKIKLINLYKEMLKYAGKKYQDDWDFKKFTEEVSKQYSFFNEDLYHVYEALQYKTLRVDIEDDVCDIDEETAISLAEELYEELENEEIGYKDKAYFYKDIELEEGKTYWDAYLEEKEKFAKLYKKMLDNNGVKYRENDNYDTLLSLVLKEYPQYENILLFEIERHNIDETYIQIINRMERIYDELNNNEKN